MPRCEARRSEQQAPAENERRTRLVRRPWCIRLSAREKCHERGPGPGGPVWITLRRKNLTRRARSVWQLGIIFQDKHNLTEKPECTIGFLALTGRAWARRGARGVRDGCLPSGPTMAFGLRSLRRTSAAGRRLPARLAPANAGTWKLAT